MASELKRRGSYLSVTQAFNLNAVARVLTAAFGHCVYHVGSSLERPTYRDVDLRCILDDGEFDAFVGVKTARLKLLNTALSEWMTARTGLPIDFQFQRMTDANGEFPGARQAVGMHRTSDGEE